jgi:DNA-binding transcriptional LysR family regulator
MRFSPSFHGIIMMVDPPRARPSLRMIEAFEAVARLGSRAAAAAELNVTPGAISKQLRALEHWVGQKLFAEEGRDAMLNAAGRRLAQSTTAGLAQIGDGLAALRPADKARTLQPEQARDQPFRTRPARSSAFWRRRPSQ